MRTQETVRTQVIDPMGSSPMVLWSVRRSAEAVGLNMEVDRPGP